MTTKTETGKAEEQSFANKLAKAGFNDFYVIETEQARKLLTDKRRELVSELREDSFSSIRELSRHLDRDVKQVKNDLDTLEAISLIEYTEKGNSKRPELRHEHIFIKPL